MAMIDIELNLNPDEVPEWMPADILACLLRDATRLCNDFMTDMNKILARYEAEAREVVGDNILPFRSEIDDGE